MRPTLGWPGVARPASDNGDHLRHLVEGKAAAQASWQDEIGPLSFYNVRHLLAVDILEFFRCHVGAGQNPLSLQKIRRTS